MDHERELLELSDMVDNLYIQARQMRAAENKPRYYGSEFLLYPNEVYTLKMIVQHEGINQTELSEQMFRTKGATSVAVRKLVQKGLVEQRDNERDSRISQLYPTEQGRQVYQKHLEYDMRFLEYLSVRLKVSLEELATANRILRRMRSDFTRRRKEGEDFDNIARVPQDVKGEIPAPPRELCEGQDGSKTE